MNLYRATIENGQVWFCLADVCRALNLPQPSDMVAKITTGKKQKLKLSNAKNAQQMWFIDLKACQFLENKNQTLLTLDEIETQMKRLSDMKQALMRGPWVQNEN